MKHFCAPLTINHSLYGIYRERLSNMMDDVKFAMMQNELNRVLGVDKEKKSLWSWIRRKITRG